MRITIGGVEMTFNRTTRKVGWMSDWRQCWELARKGLLDSNYWTHLHGHVDFFIPKEGKENHEL